MERMREAGLYVKGVIGDKSLLVYLAERNRYLSFF
jgi:hypothetical protein